MVVKKGDYWVFVSGAVLVRVSKNDKKTIVANMRYSIGNEVCELELLRVGVGRTITSLKQARHLVERFVNNFMMRLSSGQSAEVFDVDEHFTFLGGE